jgi:hypothetical protein
MMNVKAYNKTILDLRESLLKATGLASLALPGNLDRRSAFARMGGTSHDNHVIRALAEQLDCVLVEFGRLQTAVGLPDRSEPRFERFLRGKCTWCETQLDPTKERPVASAQP